MKTNRELALAVKHALATGTIALCGAGSVATYATQASTAQPSAAPVTAATTASLPKAVSAKANAPTLLAQAAVLPQPSNSSTLPPPALQTVVVTGSLIARPAAETAEAITVLKATAIQNQGIVNVEQALDTLTNNVPALNIAATVGTFSGGGTFANLRGMGNGRTLVLLDNQRLATNANTGDAVDLSGIPFSAIDSVQVLREGASALYGSDAIAGVINFVTKKNYQGAEIQLNASHPQQAGGSSGYGNFTVGYGDLVSDGYNVMLTGSYSKQDELKATERSFSALGFYPDQGVPNTNGSGTWPATIKDANGNFWQFGYPACAGNDYLTEYYGNCDYRYSAATDLIPQSNEGSGLATLTKALPANNTLRLQYLYARSTIIGWSGPNFYEYDMTPQDNPNFYPSAANLTCNTQFTPNGICTAPPDLTAPITATWSDPNNARYLGDINTEQRAILTFSGANAGWDYKLNLNYSQNVNDQRNDAGFPNEAVLAQGVNPVDAIPILSNLINPFGPQTAAGQALINSSYVSGIFTKGKEKRWSVDGNATHSLGDAFNAGTPGTVALGFSMEGQKFTFATTPYNDLVHAATGFSDQSIAGARTAQAVFIELDMPMAKSLDVDVSDREDRYSDFGRTNNGKVTVRYQPSHYLTFRGAASTGFRAPTLFDLYQPNNIAASSSGTMGENNPFCVPGAMNGEWTATVCANQGLGVAGGNVHLTPETSQNFDIGVIVAPVRDLGVTLDYYRIILKNTIGAVPATAIYANPTAFANLIVPNANGTLTPSISEATACTPYTLPSCGYILLTLENTGATTTDGVDLSIQYLQDTPLGTFREDLEGTTVTQFRLQQYAGGPILNLVGNNQGGVNNPPLLRWQHDLRLDWTSPAGTWGGGLSNRFFSRYIDALNIGPTNTGPQRIVGSQSTWNAYASYKPIRPLTVLFGIQNVLNTNPPFTNGPQTNFAAGYSNLFSNPLMRTFYLNVTYRIF